MPTYLQLAAEPEWGAQFTPSAMTAELLAPLRAFYGLGPASIGAAGDNNHLYGRHRSYAWDRSSRYCTDRSYGTTDGRDQGGDRNWYRASDIGITGQRLFDASRRIDALVRAGRAPGIAEWFGTFDGETVVGWFEGHPSSSDDSHLWHLHLGFWNESANDAALMRLVYAAVAGSQTPQPQRKDDDMFMLRDKSGSVAMVDGIDPATRRARAYWIGNAEFEEYKRAGVELRQLDDANWALYALNPAPPAGGPGGTAVDYDRIEHIVDEQLDQQSLGGADNDSGA